MSRSTNSQLLKQMYKEQKRDRDSYSEDGRSLYSPIKSTGHIYNNVRPNRSRSKKGNNDVLRSSKKLKVVNSQPDLIMNSRKNENRAFTPKKKKWDDR